MTDNHFDSERLLLSEADAGECIPGGGLRPQADAQLLKNVIKSGVKKSSRIAANLLPQSTHDTIDQHAHKIIGTGV